MECLNETDDTRKTATVISIADENLNFPITTTDRGTVYRLLLEKVYTLWVALTGLMPMEAIFR